MTTPPRMTCRELVEFLGDYLDGELAAEVRERFEQHVSDCPPCVRYLESYRTTVTLARRAFDDPPPGEASAAPEELIRAILAARDRQEP